MPIYLTLITAQVRVPASRSLKEKRAILRPIKDRLKHRFNVSVLENDFHDDKKAGSLLIAGLAEGRRSADSIAASLINFIETNFGDLDITLDEEIILVE